MTDSYTDEIRAKFDKGLALNDSEVRQLFADIDTLEATVRGTGQALKELGASNASMRPVLEAAMKWLHEPGDSSWRHLYDAVRAYESSNSTTGDAVKTCRFCGHAGPSHVVHVRPTPDECVECDCTVWSEGPFKSAPTETTPESKSDFKRREAILEYNLAPASLREMLNRAVVDCAVNRTTVLESETAIIETFRSYLQTPKMRLKVTSAHYENKDLTYRSDIADAIVQAIIEDLTAD